MAEYQNLLYQKQRQGVLITLNRPKALNALNEALMSDLDQALAEADDFEGCAVWQQVISAIKELRRHSRVRGELIH